MNYLFLTLSLIFAMVIVGFNFSNSTKNNPANPNSNFTVTGHRGYAGKYPENTIIAIKKALELEVDRIEIDVQQTKDSVIVLMHDNSIDRTTNGKGKIKDYNYEDLKIYSTGIKFNHIFREQKIPTLKEVLDTVNGKATLVIEIKEGSSYYPNIENNILQLIEMCNATDWCIIHSFKDKVLEKVHKLDSTIILHKLLLSPLFYDLKKLGYIDEFSIYQGAISPDLINGIHQMDKKINAWTVNEEARMKELIGLGIDGIITDHPDIAKQFQQP